MTPESNQQARAWAIVGVVFLSMGSTIGAAQYAFGLFVAPIEETFGWTRTQISASLSFIAVGSLTAPIIGRIMDRYGARPVLVASLVLSAVSYLLRPFMTELWHWYALSLIQFLGLSGATVLPGGRLVAIWFGNRRGRVMGIASMGPNFGGLMLPIMVVAVISVSDWRWAYVSIGLLMLGIAAFGAVVIRERPSLLGEADLPRNPAGGPNTDLPGWEVRDALRSPRFYFIALATVAGYFTFGTVLPHVTVHLTNEGFSIGTASQALATLAMAGMAGKLFFGYLSERITARWSFVVDLLGQALAVFLLISADGTALLAMVPVYGFFMGGTGVLSMLVVQEAFGIRNYGSIFGLCSMAGAVSFGFGPLLAGASYDRTDSYESAFLLVAGIFVGGALLLCLARPSRQVVD